MLFAFSAARGAAAARALSLSLSLPLFNSGIVHLHAKHIMHRDIKGGNVIFHKQAEVGPGPGIGFGRFLCPRPCHTFFPHPPPTLSLSPCSRRAGPQVKIVDFDTALPHAPGRKKTHYHTVGTPYWMAPEVAACAFPDVRSSVNRHCNIANAVRAPRSSSLSSLARCWPCAPAER